MMCNRYQFVYPALMFLLIGSVFGQTMPSAITALGILLIEFYDFSFEKLEMRVKDEDLRIWSF